MFTGIIQTIGNIASITPSGDDIKLAIETDDGFLDDVVIGDSIAVNGVCLTVTALDHNQFNVHVSQASLDVTTGLNTTQAVNLEKALRLSDRLGGHLVSGHVDGLGEVTQFEPVGDCWLLAVKAPHTLSKYIAHKGSIAINGISLTINAIDIDTFTVNIIPHTIEQTTIQHFTIGTIVNLEVDQIARYVERMTEWSTQATEST